MSECDYIYERAGSPSKYCPAGHSGVMDGVAVGASVAGTGGGVVGGVAVGVRVGLRVAGFATGARVGKNEGAGVGFPVGGAVVGDGVGGGVVGALDVGDGEGGTDRTVSAAIGSPTVAVKVHSVPVTLPARSQTGALRHT